MKALILGDFHTGHCNGWTPRRKVDTVDADGIDKLTRKFFKRTGPYDVVLSTGDLIDGKAGRNAGVELLTTDMSVQRDWAIELLDSIPVTKRCKWFFAAGTRYHGGESEDFERDIANCFGGLYGPVVWVDTPVVIRMRHHINRAMNCLVKQRDIHMARVGYGTETLADMLLYGHLHEHRTELWEAGGRVRYAMVAPSLQGMTDFGGRRCDGNVHIGCMCCEIDKNGVHSFQKSIVQLGRDTWGMAKEQGAI